MIDGSMAARDSIGAEVDGWRSAAAASAKCDFSGKSHSNISMGDSAKVALFASETVRPSRKHSTVSPEAIGHRNTFAMINHPLPIPAARGSFGGSCLPQ